MQIDTNQDRLWATLMELGAENVLAFAVEPVGGLATGAQMLFEEGEITIV